MEAGMLTMLTVPHREGHGDSGTPRQTPRGRQRSQEPTRALETHQYTHPPRDPHV